MSVVAYEGYPASLSIPTGRGSGLKIRKVWVQIPPEARENITLVENRIRDLQKIGLSLDQAIEVIKSDQLKEGHLAIANAITAVAKVIEGKPRNGF